MNFPGLELAWTSWYGGLHQLQLASTWDLDQCKNALNEDQASVLVVASTALGDTVLCTPLLETLSKELGRERVSFLVRQPYLDLYREDPRMAGVATLQGKFRGLGSLKKQLHRLPHPPRLALIANCSEPDVVPWLWQCGIRGFLRYRTRWSRWPNWFANMDMMRPPSDPLYATGHAIDNNMAMAEVLGLHVVERRVRLHVSPERSRALPEPLTGRLLIHPGASRADKQWPIERWAEVCQVLAQEFGLACAVTGSTAERELAEDLVQRLPSGSRNLAGELALPDLVALQSRSPLFLSGDTGPYHCAMAVNCPTVTLFAPRDRGSSAEACGKHPQFDGWASQLETDGFGRPISDLQAPEILDAARSILKQTLQKTR